MNLYLNASCPSFVKNKLIKQLFITEIDSNRGIALQNCAQSNFHPCPCS